MNFIHILIPTPVLVEDLRASLNQAMVLFRTDGCFLQKLMVFDGPNSIATFDRQSRGDHSNGLDGENTFVVNKDGIAFGVGLTLVFQSDLGVREGGDVYIASAGCDFLHNI